MVIIQPLVAFWEILASRISFLSELYIYYYKDVVQREIELANINSNDIVLNIGCGGIPFTAIHIARKTKAKVCAIDRDRKAVEHARACIEQLGLSENIKVLECDGAKCIPVNFTVALVALQAEPKRVLLEKLLEKAARGGRIVFRKPSKIVEKHYDNLPKDYPIAKMVNQDMKTFDSSVLYIK